MFWLAITTTLAALPPADDEVTTLDPVLRAWGGGGSCDASSAIDAAGARIVGRPWRDDPAQVVHENMDVLRAWDRARSCGSIERATPEDGGVFARFHFGGVLIAAARNAERRGDVARAAELATEAFVFGNDASTGAMVSAMAGAAVHRSALDLLADLWPRLSDSSRARHARQLRHARQTSLGLDTAAERVSVRRLAGQHQEQTWVPTVACLAAHDASMDRVERVLDGAPRAELRGDHDDGWLAWLGASCARGVEEITLDWLEEQDTIEGQLIQLEQAS